MSAAAVLSRRPRLDAARIKYAIPPLSFFANELPGMPMPKATSGWTCGGRCPFHDDHRAGSFRVNLDTGAFVCFSCGTKGGDIISFVQLRHALSFASALEALAGEWELET